jgi:outer membrane lipase/esterase
MKSSVLTATLLALAILSTPGAAGLNQFVGLGDSTIDTGYFRFSVHGSVCSLGRRVHCRQNR